MQTDRIDRQIVLRAPRARVWAVLAEAREFGRWFGVNITEGEFAPGATLRGQITNPGYAHLTMTLTVDQVERERLLSWRWHPHAIEPGVDYSHEPTTLVEFALSDVEGGTLLRVSESGFDQLPATRRELAFRRNGEGWAIQTENIARYLAQGGSDASSASA